jgi:hypothetical protein
MKFGLLNRKDLSAAVFDHYCNESYVGTHAVRSYLAVRFCLDRWLNDGSQCPYKNLIGVLQAVRIPTEQYFNEILPHLKSGHDRCFVFYFRRLTAALHHVRHGLKFLIIFIFRLGSSSFKRV